MRQRLLCVWSLMLSAVAAGHSISDTPFRNGVNFYVVNAKDEALRVEVLTDAGTPEPDREGLAAYLMLRCYGPDDRLVVAREVQLPRLQRWKVKLDVPSSGPGVYTLMVTGGAPDWVGIKPQPELPYGVMGRSRLEVRGDVLAKRFVYVPRNCFVARFRAEETPPRGRRTLLLFDEKNKALAAVRSVRGHNVIRVEPEAKDVMWRIETRGRGPFTFTCAGMPGILCPNADVAKKIKASAIYLDDVTLQHRWQVDMWQMLKAMDPADMEVSVQALDGDALKQAGRPAAFALGRCGPLSWVPLVLAEQDMEAGSHWFGSIRGWREAQGQEPPHDRWDSGSRTGYVNAAGAAGILAWAYGADLSGNPYYKQKGMLNRAMAASFLHYLGMNEAEQIEEPGLQLAGEMGWQRYHARYLSDGPALLHYLGDDVPAEARALWVEAISRQAERLAYFDRWATSQWAATTLAHAFAADATGSERCRHLWRRHSELLLRDAMAPQRGLAKAGYFRESRGADGEFNAVSMFYLGCLYRLTRDPMVGEGVRLAWELRRHLTLPEPDGERLSPTNFNSRSSTPFARPHFPDAALCAGWLDVASAALRRETGRGATVTWSVCTQADMDEAVDLWAGRDATEWHSGLVADSFTVAALLADMAEPALTATAVPLPVERGESFAKCFGDEFICVRRPAYAAVLYIAARTDPFALSRVMQGGGLSELWTPACGASIYSVNDGPWSNHGITGVTTAGRLVSSSYSSPTVTHSADAVTLTPAGPAATSTDAAAAATCTAAAPATTVTVTGLIRGTPLRYRRTYAFADAYVVMGLSITCDRAWECQSLYEVLPYHAGPGKTIVALTAQGTEVKIEPGTPARLIGFALRNGDGRVDVVFSAAMDLLVSPCSGGTLGQPVGRVLVALPTSWSRGQRLVVSSLLHPRTAREPAQRPAPATR